MKLLLYCTKSKPYLFKSVDCMNQFGKYYTYSNNKHLEGKELNGKIVGKCDFEVEEIKHYIHYEPKVDVGIGVLPEFECSAYTTNSLDHFQLLEKSGLKDYSLPNITVANGLDDYLKGKNGYAIHIKNLHIFDKPKELSDYYIKECLFSKCSNCQYGKNKVLCGTIDSPITKAPQNMMYVYDGDEKKVLISIRPEWLCKILNGEKKIEVRKKVLKEMIKK